jgi:hypothetical protein
LARGAIGLDGQRAIEVVVCRHQQQREHLAGWRLAYRRNSGSSHVLGGTNGPGQRNCQGLSGPTQKRHRAAALVHQSR